GLRIGTAHERPSRATIPADGEITGVPKVPKVPEVPGVPRVRTLGTPGTTGTYMIWRHDTAASRPPGQRDRHRRLDGAACPLRLSDLRGLGVLLHARGRAHSDRRRGHLGRESSFCCGPATAGKGSGTPS